MKEKIFRLSETFIKKNYIDKEKIDELIELIEIPLNQEIPLYSIQRMRVIKDLKKLKGE